MSEVGDALKLLTEAVSAWKKVKKNIDANAKRKRKKKLLKACWKALKTGKEKDLDTVRDHLYVRNWLK